MKKGEILRGTRNFAELHRDGRRLRGTFAHCIYRSYPREDVDRATIRVGFAVGKRTGSAVQRNALRRAMKEAYRGTKLSLTKAAEGLGVVIDVVFVVSSASSGISEKMHIATDISRLLDAVERQLTEGAL